MIFSARDAAIRRIRVFAIAGAVFWLGFEGGAYALTDRTATAVGVWWAILLAVGLGLWPRARIPGTALAAGAALAALTAWTGLSAFWTESGERAVQELARVALYAGVLALVVLATRAGSGRRWVEGTAIGLAAVGLVGLAARFFPDVFPEGRELAQLFPLTEGRASYPVDYWNGLATIVALAVPLLLSLAVSARSALARGLAMAPLPALAGTVYLTSSRGGSAVLVLGTIVFFALTTRRWAASAAIALAGAAGVATLIVLRARPDLVDRPFSPEAAGQGEGAALLIALLCLAVGVAYGLGARFLPSPPPLPRALAGVFAILALLVVVGGIAAAHPLRRFEKFKEVDPTLARASVESHLLSGSGAGRWQLWESAVDGFQSRPWTGRGGGSYEAWWAEHGTLPVFVRDAHSLYLETAAELGVVGLGLLLAFLAAVAWAAVARLRQSGPAQRPLVAGLIAAFVAYLVEAGIDWMWELTAVSVAAVVCAGLLVGSALRAPDPAERKPSSPGRSSLLDGLSRVAAVLAASAVLVVQTSLLLGAAKIRESQEAAGRGDLAGALDAALAARSIQPWAASPRLAIALVQEQAGDVPAAVAAIHEALERDPSDWRLWLIAARLETKAGRFEAAQQSLDRAAELNPRSPLFARASPSM